MKRLQVTLKLQERHLKILPLRVIIDTSRPGSGPAFRNRSLRCQRLQMTTWLKCDCFAFCALTVMKQLRVIPELRGCNLKGLPLPVTDDTLLIWWCRSVRLQYHNYMAKAGLHGRFQWMLGLFAYRARNCKLHSLRWKDFKWPFARELQPWRRAHWHRYEDPDVVLTSIGAKNGLGSTYAECCASSSNLGSLDYAWGLLSHVADSKLGCCSSVVSWE